MSQSQSNSGKQVFKDYCAACHGMDGKGNGPAVQFLKAPPPDLTTMAKRYNEKSVGLKLEAILSFGTESKAHGTLDMPTWGPMFRTLNPDKNNQVAKLRMYNLAEYVKSIQQK
jgi:mono/diheme cytochrome c family protein